MFYFKYNLYNIKNKIERNAIALIFCPLIIILIIVNLITTLFSIDNQEYILSSPNKKNAIILDENTFLSTTYYSIYEQKDIIFKKSISSDIHTYNYLPFDNYDYSINWENDNTVTISYNYSPNIKHDFQITLTLNW